MPGTDALEALAVQQEAKRFENFHESAQQLHDLLEELDNVPLKRKMRQKLTRIEDCFLSSPEFTGGRLSSNQELKLGIVGSAVSGKSFLLQCFLSGTQSRMESSYTGRYKKEVKFRGSSYLLLIRDETGPPDLQFTQWVDAIMFVFSLDDELSFSVIHQYYSRMSQYRNIVDLPVILVAMKDGVTKDHPSPVCTRHISKLIVDLKQCVYLEASAFNGENVDNTFHTAVEKLIQAKTDSPVLTSFDPLHSPTAKEVEQANIFLSSPANNNNNGGSGPNSAATTPSSSTKRGSKRRTMLFSKDKKEKEKEKDAVDGDFGSGRSIPLKQGYLYKKSATSINKEWKKKFVTLCGDGFVVYYPNLHDYMNDVHSKAIVLKHTTVKVPGKRPPKASHSQGGSGSRPTTPIDSTLFSECSNCDSNPDSLERSGSIPNGFDSSVHRSSATDMENILANIGTSMIIPNANVIPPSSSATYPTTPSKTDSNSLVKKKNKRSKHTKSCEIDYEELEKAFATAANNAAAAALEVQPSSLRKKGHRRVKSGSGSGKLDNDSEMSGWEFTIVSLEGKMWQFEAATAQERDTWVHAIEQQILSCLQSNESNRDKGRKGSTASSDCSFDIQSIRNVEGNSQCVDCTAPNPDWASLNLGALMCIECSGVHRNLGTHLSRVRSLDLDEWPSELTAVMCSIGNHLANSIWEGKKDDSRRHPSPSSSREEKERWIRAKYESKEMLSDLPPSEFSLGEQLHDAVSKEDLPLCIVLLAHCCTEDVSAASDDADGFSPLHISCSLGNIVITQLLIWSFADVKKLDAKGRSPLWYAKSAGSKECADILRHNGCNDLGTLIPRGSDVVC